MGKGAPKTTPTIIVPQAPTAPQVFRPEEIAIAEQKRRAGISDTKKSQSASLLGASLDSDATSLLKKNILGV